MVARTINKQKKEITQKNNKEYTTTTAITISVHLIVHTT